MCQCFNALHFLFPTLQSYVVSRCRICKILFKLAPLSLKKLAIWSRLELGDLEEVMSTDTDQLVVDSLASARPRPPARGKRQKL